MGGVISVYSTVGSMCTTHFTHTKPALFRHKAYVLCMTARIYTISRRASLCPDFMNDGPSPFTCSAVDLAEIRRSSKISSWIPSIIYGVVTVLGRPGRGAKQVEKSLCLNWVTQFLTVVYDGACSPNVSVRMAWISFGALPCRKKKTWWQLVPRCCWNRARRLTCFLSASVTRKDLQFGTWTDSSFQRHYWFRPTTWGSRSG